jgi:hypothetical protein
VDLSTRFPDPGDSSLAPHPLCLGGAGLSPAVLSLRASLSPSGDLENDQTGAGRQSCWSVLPAPSGFHCWLAEPGQEGSCWGPELGERPPLCLFLRTPILCFSVPPPSIFYSNECQYNTHRVCSNFTCLLPAKSSKSSCANSLCPQIHPGV